MDANDAPTVLNHRNMDTPVWVDYGSLPLKKASTMSSSSSKQPRHPRGVLIVLLGLSWAIAAFVLLTTCA